MTAWFRTKMESIGSDPCQSFFFYTLAWKRIHRKKWYIGLAACIILFHRAFKQYEDIGKLARTRSSRLDDTSDWEGQQHAPAPQYNKACALYVSTGSYLFNNFVCNRNNNWSFGKEDVLAFLSTQSQSLLVHSVRLLLMLNVDNQIQIRV